MGLLIPPEVAQGWLYTARQIGAVKKILIFSRIIKLKGEIAENIYPYFLRFGENEEDIIYKEKTFSSVDYAGELIL